MSLGSVDMKKSKNITKYIPTDEYDDDKYKFDKNGFECININSILNDIVPIINKSQRLEINDIPTSTEWAEPINQNAIDILESFVEKKYKELMNINSDTIKVVASRNLIFRIAGAKVPSNQIPGNPLTHLDYSSFENARKRQCEQFKGFEGNTTNPNDYPQVKCPENAKMIDFVNIWFPTTLIQDWSLGFIVPKDDDIPIANIQVEDYKIIQIVSGSIASSIEPRDDIKVAYKKDMNLGEAYLFRSATEYTEKPENADETFNLNDHTKNKKGLYHGSFRITDNSFERRSIELRFLVSDTSQPSNNYTQTAGKKTKTNKKRTLKYRMNKTKGKLIKNSKRVKWFKSNKNSKRK
jgi:hypothetical protein